MGVSSVYSQRSAKKTLIFVIALLGVAIVLATVAVYMTYKQSSVMTQSTYFEKPTPATGSLEN
jgi:hypothetical protein